MKAKYFIGIYSALLLTGSTIKGQPADTREFRNDNAGIVVNNYFDDYNYYYTSRINRFHRSYSAFDYYSPLFTDLYWYNYQPFSWGISIYDGGFGFGYGYNYPVYNLGFYNYGYDPYFGSSYYWAYDPFYYYGWYRPALFNIRFGYNRNDYYYGWNRNIYRYNDYRYDYYSDRNRYNNSSERYSSRSSSSQRRSEKINFQNSGSVSGREVRTAGNSRRGENTSGSVISSNNRVQPGTARRNESAISASQFRSSSLRPQRGNISSVVESRTISSPSQLRNSSSRSEVRRSSSGSMARSYSSSSQARSSSSGSHSRSTSSGSRSGSSSSGSRSGGRR